MNVIIVLFVSLVNAIFFLKLQLAQLCWAFYMYKSLSKPSKTQQWYKVDGKYVLINTTNHKIVKVIG